MAYNMQLVCIFKQKLNLQLIKAIVFFSLQGPVCNAWASANSSFLGNYADYCLYELSRETWEIVFQWTFIPDFIVSNLWVQTGIGMPLESPRHSGQGPQWVSHHAYWDQATKQEVCDWRPSPSSLDNRRSTFPGSGAYTKLNVDQFRTLWMGPGWGSISRTHTQQVKGPKFYAVHCIAEHH